MAWHVFLLTGTVLSGISVPRGLAWLTALFGTEHFSQRAMRLLRRPPMDGPGKSRTQ
jgi:hypothetical protein